MAGSRFTPAYTGLVAALVRARHDRGISQAGLAKMLGKPPSFVGKYELGERRLDVIELMVILDKLELDFNAFWSAAGINLPKQL